jgi:AmmeMemoRadiSam system protein A
VTDRESVTLIGLARDAIMASFERRKAAIPNEPWLQEPRAVFVSLHEAATDELRGCVGTIEPHESLGQAVVTAAEGAAFRDTRFDPLRAAELPRMRVEVSVLSPMALLPAPNEAAARTALARMRSGVLLRAGTCRGVLLPKVWDTVPEPGEFLRILKLKAGIPANAWPESIQLYTFTCEECAE